MSARSAIEEAQYRFFGKRTANAKDWKTFFLSPSDAMSPEFAFKQALISAQGHKEDIAPYEAADALAKTMGNLYASMSSVHHYYDGNAVNLAALSSQTECRVMRAICQHFDELVGDREFVFRCSLAGGPVAISPEPDCQESQQLLRLVAARCFDSQKTHDDVVRELQARIRVLEKCVFDFRALRY